MNPSTSLLKRMVCPGIGACFDSPGRDGSVPLSRDADGPLGRAVHFSHLVRSRVLKMMRAERQGVRKTSVSDTLSNGLLKRGFRPFFRFNSRLFFYVSKTPAFRQFWNTMNLGYARVSTDDQELHLQTDALERAGCERLFTDKASGTREDRLGLAEALHFARKGDTLIVWRIDRLGRSLSQLIELVAKLKASGIHLRSLQEHIDTSSAGGELVFHVFGAMAQFERSLIRERTLAGLAAARARGRKGGRPAVDAQKVRAIRALAKDPSVNVMEACETLGVSRATFYRYKDRDPVPREK